MTISLRSIHPRRLSSLMAALLLSVPTLSALPPVDDDNEPISDDEEQQMLSSGVTDTSSDEDDIDIPIPSFIKTSANHITFNGSDWSALRRDVA